MNAMPGIQSAAGLRVRFVEGQQRNLTVLEIELPREQEMLGDVHTELRALGIEVTNIEVRANADRVIERLHIREIDGRPVSRERHLEIQDRVLGVFQVRLTRPRSGTQPAVRVAVG
jgi:hypothetical protein